MQTASDEPPTESPAASGRDSDIEQLLKTRLEVDAALRQHKAEYAVLFADIVGSTAFFDRFGDTAGLLMVQQHEALVVPAIAAHDGTVVKTIGDAVLAMFSQPLSAVRAAVAIQEGMHAYNVHRPPRERIYTRVGINYGTGFLRDGDVFGDVVNVAARIVKECAPAQILVARSVQEAVAGVAGVMCRPLGTAAFHGKSEEEAIYEVQWLGEAQALELRRDLAAVGPREVLGRYEILEELGRGAMGVVYKAFDPTLARFVAIKTFRLDVPGADRQELASRLRHEARAVGRLQEHPNVAAVYDADEADGVFYLAMPLVKGRLLQSLMTPGSLRLEEMLLLGEQVCEGLSHAHECGVVHRDLKPSNMMVTADGTVKVLDFGVAAIGGLVAGKNGAAFGTISYMSPEQAQGGAVDHRGDIFSLGAILYELVTGEKAFPGLSPTTVVHKILHEEPIAPRVIEPAVHPDLERIILRALQKAPEQRYATCAAFGAELAAFRATHFQRPKLADAVARLTAAARPRGRRRRDTGARLLALLLLLGLSLGLFAWDRGWLVLELHPPRPPRIGGR